MWPTWSHKWRNRFWKVKRKHQVQESPTTDIQCHGVTSEPKLISRLSYHLFQCYHPFLQNLGCWRRETFFQHTACHCQYARQLYSFRRVIISTWHIYECHETSEIFLNRTSTKLWRTRRVQTQRHRLAIFVQLLQHPSIIFFTLYQSYSTNHNT